MSRYYTRVCNFYYGAKSKLLVKKKKTLPLHNNPEISFDKIDSIRGMDITIVTSASTDQEGKSLLKELGMPFSN